MSNALLFVLILVLCVNILLIIRFWFVFSDMVQAMSELFKEYLSLAKTQKDTIAKLHNDIVEMRKYQQVFTDVKRLNSNIEKILKTKEK